MSKLKVVSFVVWKIVLVPHILFKFSQHNSNVAEEKILCVFLRIWFPGVFKISKAKFSEQTFCNIIFRIDFLK